LQETQFRLSSRRQDEGADCRDGRDDIAGSPAAFGKLVADETEKWGKVVRFSGAKAD
jgi:hypothetical protein